MFTITFKSILKYLCLIVLSFALFNAVMFAIHVFLHSPDRFVICGETRGTCDYLEERQALLDAWSKYYSKLERISFVSSLILLIASVLNGKRKDVRAITFFMAFWALILGIDTARGGSEWYQRFAILPTPPAQMAGIAASWLLVAFVIWMVLKFIEERVFERGEGAIRFTDYSSRVSDIFS